MATYATPRGPRRPISAPAHLPHRANSSAPPGQSDRARVFARSNAKQRTYFRAAPTTKAVLLFSIIGNSLEKKRMWLLGTS